MSKPVAIAVQTFRAPPEQVYDAILDPAMIARFMFGERLREEEILHIRNEPKVGSAFSFKVRCGGQVIEHVGRYLELDRPRSIAFTWALADHRNQPALAAAQGALASDLCAAIVRICLRAGEIDQIRRGYPNRP